MISPRKMVHGVAGQTTEQHVDWCHRRYAINNLTPLVQNPSPAVAAAAVVTMGGSVPSISTRRQRRPRQGKAKATPPLSPNGPLYACSWNFSEFYKVADRQSLTRTSTNHRLHGTVCDLRTWNGFSQRGGRWMRAFFSGILMRAFFCSSISSRNLRCTTLLLPAERMVQRKTWMPRK